MNHIDTYVCKPRSADRFRYQLRCALLELFSTKLPTFPHKVLTDAQRRKVKELLQPGDILLDSNYVFLLPQLGNRLFFGSSWIHTAIYIGEDNLIDSGRKFSVMQFPLEKFLNTTGLAVYRPKFQSPEDVEAMISYAKNAVGLPFNVTFDPSEAHSFYCGQLVASALRAMPHPIILRSRAVFGKNVVPAAAVTDSSDIDCIWSSNPRFVTNVGSHWPSLAASMLGSNYSHLIGINSLAGGAIGLIALILIANSSKWFTRDHGLVD